MRCHAFIIGFCLAATAFVAEPAPASDAASLRPVPREVYLPKTKWDFRDEGALWTRATMTALQEHGRPLIKLVPADIETWCPAYPENGPVQRAAFWTGFISSLVEFESTFKPRAVGGGGRWFGLTQILPGTARSYNCRAGTGEALRNGSANLSCAVRIMARTVARDGVVALKNGRRAGVAADWGPLSSKAKRTRMARFTRDQTYCRSLSSVRPVERPNWREASAD